MTVEGQDWTRDEVESVVADYFAMLEAELREQPYSKVDHNRRLQGRIARSKGAIEFKHQNISAVLANFRQPFIPGYLPRRNYQLLLEQAVLEWLAVHPRFFSALADSPVLAPTDPKPIPPATRISDLVEAPPEDPFDPEEPDDDKTALRFVRIDFVRRDAENRRLGRLGEEWVVEFERRRLHDQESRPDLARKVEWTSDSRGDGAGYDVHSFNADGTDRLIEVKTTGLGKHFPFLVTANELSVSESLPAAYTLYRVFDYSREPRVYMLRGALSERCRLDPTQFRARVKTRTSQ